MTAALLIAGVALLVGAAPAQAGTTVRIYDNYYFKDDLTVKRGAVVTWRWPGFYEAGDVHDVKLKSGPKGAKKFHSEAAATDFTSAARSLSPTSSSWARLPTAISRRRVFSSSRARRAVWLASRTTAAMISTLARNPQTDRIAIANAGLRAAARTSRRAGPSGKTLTGSSRTKCRKSSARARTLG